MRLGLALLVVCTSSSAALARPFTFGVGAGTVQSENDTDDEAERVLEAWGRVGLTPRFGLQLDVEKFTLTQDEVTVRSGTALAVFELGALGRSRGLVPLVFGGVGIDHASTPYGGTEDGSHVEGGLGLELRLDGGLVISADARIGSRSPDDRQDSEPVILDGQIGVMAYSQPILPDGQYRSVRVGVGLRF
jgi:hypothetical protein